MNCLKKGIIICSIFLGITGLANAKVVNLKPKEEKQWFYHLLPLPHKIFIKKKNVLNPKDISIRLRKNAGEVEKNAVFELKQLFKEKAGIIPSGKKFEILIGVLDSRGRICNLPVANVKRIKEVPNNNQAYIIQPKGQNKLLITGLNEKGVYYGVRTLYQLLEPVITANKVSIPLATVLDWPDMEERGLWSFSPEWIPWLASIKLNYGTMPTKLHKIIRDKPNRATINQELLQKAKLMAFNYVPYIIHLNFLDRRDLYKAYPELAGKGDSALAGRYFAHKQGSQHRVPCASNPILTRILTEWMMDIASQGAQEISCWLSERPAQCGCEKCLKEGQFAWEARAFVNAWREVRKKYPNFIIRLFISTTTNEKYYKVLAETPPEVKIERRCNMDSARVRHLPRDLFINPLFDYYAAHGRWVASYDVPYPANGAVETPEFKVPESSAHRIKDFVGQLIKRNYKGAYGMTGWYRMGKEICGFNYQALAEWSWNLNGRTEREFAIAWATREEYENPEAVGEWSELMGPVEFDVYDSDFPMCYSWGEAIKMVKEKNYPYLETGMFRYYSSAEDFDRKISICKRALKIAERFKNPYLANETRVVLSYVKLAKYIYKIALLNWENKLTTEEEKNQLNNLIKELKDAGRKNIEAIKQWRSALGPEPWHYRVYDAIKGTKDTVSEIIAQAYLR